MNITIVFIALIFSAGIYGAISYVKYSKIKSVCELFHISSKNAKEIKHKRYAVLSLVAANLTLGTGLVYTATMAQRQLWLAVLAPLGILVGYIILSKIIVSFSNLSGEEQGKNVLNMLKWAGVARLFFILSASLLCFRI